MKKLGLTAYNALILCSASVTSTPPQVVDLASNLQHFIHVVPTPYKAFLKGDLEQFKQLLTEETAQTDVQPDASLEELDIVQPSPLSTLLAYHYELSPQKKRVGEFIEQLIKETNPPAKTLQLPQNVLQKGTLLHLATKNDDDQLARVLAQHYPDLVNTAAQSDGRKPIHIAAEKGNLDIVKLFYEKGDNQLTSETDKKEKPIHYAAAHGKKNVVQWMLEQDPQLYTAENKHKETPLYQAAISGHHDVVMLLLEKGADPNVYSKGLFNAGYLLKDLVNKGKTNIAKTLLKHEKMQQETANAVDLHAAIRACDVELMHLLKAKMDPNTFDGKLKGKHETWSTTPKEFAQKTCDQNSDELIKLLTPEKEESATQQHST